jgi:hypothetical protein
MWAGIAVGPKMAYLSAYAQFVVKIERLKREIQTGVMQPCLAEPQQTRADD